MSSHRIERRALVPPMGGTAATPSGLGGTRSTASAGGTPSAASLGPGGTGPSNGQCRRVSNPSGRLWKAGVGCEVSGRSGALPQRQQAGALQALREFGGAGRGRGSAGSPVVACCCYRTRAEVKPGSSEEKSRQTANEPGALVSRAGGRPWPVGKGGPGGGVAAAGVARAEGRSECATGEGRAGPWRGGCEL